MSPQKHAAQIANARKSHGPITEAGRIRSSSNATRHGLASRKLRIIPPEDREEFDEHCSEMLPALAPEGPIENHLADLIVFDEWRLIRIRGLENEILMMGYTTAKDQFFAGAETWLAKSKELATLTLYEQRITRVLSRNKTEFDARQSARKASVADLPVDAGSSSPEAPLAQPAELQAEISVAPASAPAEPIASEPAGGFVHSSAAARIPLTTPATAVGFVRSSAVAPPTPDPQPLTPAVQTPATAVGFVRSSAAESPTPDPQPLRISLRYLPSCP
jgi:hypothetical protein